MVYIHMLMNVAFLCLAKKLIFLNQMYTSPPPYIPFRSVRFWVYTHQEKHQDPKKC